MQKNEMVVAVRKNVTIIAVIAALIIGFVLAVLSAKFDLIDMGKPIAYVDINQIVLSSSDLQKIQEKRKVQLEQLQAFVENARKEVAALKDKSKEQIALENKYNAELNVRKNAMDKEFADALTSVDTKVANVIKATAKKLGYEYVVPKNVLFAGGKDITSEVVSALK